MSTNVKLANCIFETKWTGDQLEIIIFITVCKLIMGLMRIQIFPTSNAVDHIRRLFLAAI
jgi:hypothetical protein